MAFKQDDDYNTVAERIIEFRAKYPKGTLRPLNPDKPYELVQMGNTLVFIVVAAAYRDEDDELPGVGMAYEPIPGSTPFTRGSELQNAETAAWGRALIAVGAADAKKGIATREDIQNAQHRQNQPAQSRVPDRSDVLASKAAEDAELKMEAEAAQVARQRAMAAARDASLKQFNDRINTLDADWRKVFTERWVANGLPKLSELNKDQFDKAQALLDLVMTEREQANRTMALDPSLNPASTPDYDAPPSDYLTDPDDA